MGRGGTPGHRDGVAGIVVIYLNAQLRLRIHCQESSVT